jgi:Tfp pilus assembly protein PilV
MRWPPALPSRRRARGLSLVEAMVALAVMAFGTLAVLGVQTTLRLNADIAKQRNEAVRIAQEALETARGFTALADYAAIAASGALPATGYDSSNTVFQVTRSVVDVAAVDTTHPRRKTVVVDVGWTDRTGQPQAVRLAAVIGGVAPALAGSLAVPSDRSLIRHPTQRHPDVPATAVTLTDDPTRSRFDPPGGAGVGWLFDNTTGAIVQTCSGPGSETCTAFDARLLAGHVRFATTAAPPTAADAELPPGVTQPVAVQLAQTAPTTGPVDCFEQTLDTSTVSYWCAVPVGGATAWSGRSSVGGLSVALDLGTDADPTRVRVCRYTPSREHRVVGFQRAECARFVQGGAHENRQAAARSHVFF